MNERMHVFWLMVMLVGANLWASVLLQAEEPVLTETFDNPTLPGWEHSPGVAVVDGVLRIEPDNFAFYPGEWGDLTLSVIARRTGEGEAVLLVNYCVSDAGDYAVHLGPDFVALHRAGAELAASPLGSIPPNEWLHVSVTVVSGTHEVVLSGQPALTATDSDPLPPGGVALSVHGAAPGEFDDLIVTFLGEDMPPPIPSELTWVRTGGPPGGLGYDIRYNFDDPNTWYVTEAFAGVHISTDNGLTWWPSNEGIAGQLGPTGDWRPIFSLTVDPHNHQVVWAGTDKTGHIYKSTDGGLTWTQKDAGVVRMTSEYDALTFRGFTVAPDTSDVVYAMGEIANIFEGGALVWGTAIGGVVYKTSDGGEHWKLLWDGGIPSSLARYMWINPENTDILYVSTGIFDRGAVNEGPESDPNPYGGLGILKSTDGGKTWRVLNEANGLNFLYIGSLFMHPDDPDILLAAAGKLETELYPDYLKENNLKTKMGLYRTTDGGETWTQVLAAGGGFNSVEMYTSDPNIAYAGSAASVYRSEDAGVTWTQVAGQGGNGWGPPGVLAGVPIDMQCDPNDPNHIFSNNYVGGNFLSEDGGKTWINASDGYTGAQITSVAIDPNNPAQIYVAGRNGIWGSSNSGSSWYGMRYPPPGQIVWGGEWGGIVVDPSNSRHLLASEETIWESFDGGSSWEVRRSPAFALAAAIVFAPSDPNTVYTGRAHPICLLNAEAPCGPGHGVYVSHDGGTTWDFANDANIADLSLIDLAVDPENARVVYVATERGLFKTTDGGATWTLMAGLPNETRVGAITVHPQNSQHLMTGVESHGLYISTDGGGTWKQIAAGLQPNSSIRDILYDPINSEIVYLSDLLSGVYRSTDGGLIWTQINQGLTTRSTTGLAISSDGQHVYVATNGGGVFRLDLTGQPPRPAPGETPEAPPVAPEPMATSSATEPSKDSGSICSGATASAVPGQAWFYRWR